MAATRGLKACLQVTMTSPWAAVRWAGLWWQALFAGGVCVSEGAHFIAIDSVISDNTAAVRAGWPGEAKEGHAAGLDVWLWSLVAIVSVTRV